MTTSPDLSELLTASANDQTVVNTALERLRHDRIVERIWQKDHTVWKPKPGEIDNRLGWLLTPQSMRSRIDDLVTFANSVRNAGFKHVVLLGMGGSSLCPEVFRVTFGSKRGYPELIVLDSTVPAWVRRVTRAIDPARTLFIASSKSGGTIEVMSFFKYFWSLVERKKHGRAGENFIAITDQGTRVEALAAQHGFRCAFLNPPDIGGRYSALSYFGLVPAALIGVNLPALLDPSIQMLNACQTDAAVNPGALLGAAMGGLALAGRDKVTLISSPSISAFGLWAEQLIAESTGKEGRGIVPIADEPFASPEAYAPDRFFIALRVERDKNAALDRHVAALKDAGHPIMHIALTDRYAMGAEFFRWEMATAIAGHILGIHPFDQPNVQESKDNTRRVLDKYQATGALPSAGGPGDASSGTALADLLSQSKPGDFVAVMAYIDEEPVSAAALADLRAAILRQHHLPSTLGYGPRFLHSTGQLHKGGANNGLFVQFTARSGRDAPIPGELFSFGVLAAAQAIGDLASLKSHDRRAIHIELGPRPATAIQKLTQSIGGTVSRKQAASKSAPAARRKPAAKPRQPTRKPKARLARKKSR